MHGWNGPNGYVPAAPITAIVCDDCAKETIPFEPRRTASCLSGCPLFAVDGTPMAWHQARPWKWAPRYGGNAQCHDCGKKGI